MELPLASELATSALFKLQSLIKGCGTPPGSRTTPERAHARDSSLDKVTVSMSSHTRKPGTLLFVFAAIDYILTHGSPNISLLPTPKVYPAVRYLSLRIHCHIVECHMGEEQIEV